MSESLERAHEAIHAHGSPHSDPWARAMALLVALLAAALALIDSQEKSAEIEFLTRHIAISDDWAFYQAKNQRSNNHRIEANILASLPNAADPTIQKRIEQATEYAARMQDDPEGGEGMKQLRDKAHAEEHQRDTAFSHAGRYGLAVSALQLAIVLASVSVVMKMRSLAVYADFPR